MRRSIAGGIAAVAGAGLTVASVSVATASPAPASTASAAGAFNLDTGFAGPAQQSTTWSGYVVAPRASLTKVGASWKVPPVVCRRTMAPEAAVFWVGLDGWYDKTVEQAGVEAYCSATTPVYTAWWELFPSNHITQVFPVRPGDQIAASVTYRGGIFTITVKDLTLRRASTVRARCPSTMTCRRSSAEWIAESPTFGARSAYLPRWGPMTFTGARSSALVNQRSDPIPGFAHFAVVMTGTDGRQAQPGSLLSGGSAFTESWLAAN
ncbi:MAG: G1 family glutamic endopeptidase [Candidatus Dormibacteria bacterium]